MRMSISTTVGRKRAAFSTASRPLLASATTSMSASPASSMRKPARTIAWSSATSTRIVTPRPRRAAGGCEHEAAAVLAARAHLAAVELDALADADEAVAEAVASPSGRAVVADLDAQLLGRVVERDVGACWRARA